jgi:hypothetical protein
MDNLEKLSKEGTENEDKQNKTTYNMLLCRIFIALVFICIAVRNSAIKRGELHHNNRVCVRFVDIGGILHHHCLNILFTIPLHISLNLN